MQDNADRGWDPRQGHCTSAYNMWTLVHKDILAFMRFGLEASCERYDRIWNEAASEPGDGSRELEDVFHARVGGLWSPDFEWMLLAAALKDAVSAYEVYVEDALVEVGKRQGFALAPKQPEKGLSFGRLIEIYKKAMGVDIHTPDVQAVRRLRHLLTHQRGELRTEKQRQEFGSIDRLLFGWRAQLTAEGVSDACEVLHARGREIDATMWPAAWGGPVPSQLAELVARLRAAEEVD